MTTAIVMHEVEDGGVWAQAWKPGPGSRHALFAQVGVRARCFRDPKNPQLTGLILEIPNMENFEKMLGSDEGKRAMTEDGLKVETMRMLVEFSP